MKRLSDMSARLRARLTEHFELFMTAVGVFLTVRLVFSDLPPGQQGLAHAFLIWLQGFLIWSVHRHATLRRQAMIDKMRLMLQDRVNNQLTVMLGMAEIRLRDTTTDGREDLEIATAAARNVAHELETLSLQSLRSWERRHPNLLR
ncbi:MAG TPA: hypothetical protein VH700_10080 [Gemmatimonadales bacterium]